jgi:hypothetical protein
MCNLYSISTNQAAIIGLFRVINQYVGNLPPMPTRRKHGSKKTIPKALHSNMRFWSDPTWLSEIE